MSVLSDLLQECQLVLTNHIFLRCQLGLRATHINNVIFSNFNETNEFVMQLLLTALRSQNIVKKQVLSLFLYSNDERKINLALKILSMNNIRFNIFLLIIHILYIIDRTSMERNGPFYNYITSSLRHTIDTTEFNEILITYDDITNSRRGYMCTFLSDFSHFVDLFIN
jgi:hypothetical protein